MEGGFSIRGYASRMRSVNVVKCWPFDEAIGADAVRSLLPPIVVKRFTWWLDELECVSSETAEELAICERKARRASERGETSSRNGGGDSEGAKAVKLRSPKGKLRATKKRSILEIFAVAPPVKRAVSGEEEEEEEEEEDDDDDGDDNLGINRASKRKRRKKKKMKMKNTDAILRKALRAVKKIKRRKAAAAAEKRGYEIPDKENSLKLKPQTQEKATGKSCSKEVANDIHDLLSIPKRKGAYKKLMPCKSSKLIEENQHLELPVRSILKSCDKEFPLKQSKKCILQETVQLSNCSAQKNKQVTFSEKGEDLRLSRKPSHSVECFLLQKDCTSDIGNVDYAVAVGKDSTIPETSGSEDASTRTGKELGAEPEINEQFSRCSIDETTFEKQIYEGEYSTSSGSSDRRGMSSVNKHWSDRGLADAPHDTMDVYSPRLLHMPRDGYYSNPNMKVIMASSKNTCGRLNKDVGTPRPIFPPLCFEDYLRKHDNASMSHPSSNMRRAYKQTQDSSENMAVNCAHSIQFQTFPHLFPNEGLQTFCSLPDGSQTGDVCGRNMNFINEEFVGLPLNSQGELIALNSSAMRDVNQMMKPSAAPCIGLSLPSSDRDSEYRDLDGRTSSTSQLNLFPIESYVKENAMSVLPSRLGITESQSEKANLDFDFLETNYHPVHNSVKTIPKSDSDILKSPENEKFQSTLRLMGKEFEVGGRGDQGFEDGRVWKDKQVIEELHFRNDQNEPSVRQLRDTLFCPSEITVNHRSESKYHVPHFDSQPSSTYKSMFLTRTVDSSQKLYPRGLSPGTLSDVYNSKSLYSEPCTAGYDSHLFTLELPTPMAPHQELRSDMGSRATQLKNKQSLHYSQISSIKFPFMHPDLDVHANSSWPRRSSLVQHPLCFDVSEKATQLSNNPSCAPVRNHPYLNPGTSYGINGSVSYRPNDLCMPSGQSVAPAPMPYYSGVLPVSSMQRKLGNRNKIKERIKSRIGVRGLDIVKKSNPPFKLFKRPILGFREGHQRAVRKPAACFAFEDTLNNMEGATFEPYDPTAKDGQTTLPWSDTYIETARTGPLKLTARAKHVLKPRPQMDHMSTDQDISLSATSIGFRF